MAKQLTMQEMNKDLCAGFKSRLVARSSCRTIVPACSWGRDRGSSCRNKNRDSWSPGSDDIDKVEEILDGIVERTEQLNHLVELLRTIHEQEEIQALVRQFKSHT
jgi:hypothetical protein